MRRTVRVAGSSRAGERGFTLVELTVAMSAGLIVAMGAFLLARNASAFFQNESRIAGAQFAAMVGMNRLTSDIRRASMGSSPNVVTDPTVCGYNAAWPSGMKQLQGIQIIQGGSSLADAGGNAQNKANLLDPDAIVVAGNMTTTEMFDVAAVAASGGTFTITLELTGAYQRHLVAAQTAANALSNVFKIGHYVRLVDQEGKQSFGVIQNLNQAGTKPIITLAATPLMPKRDAAGASCGCTGICAGTIVNPVTRVKYYLRKIDPATYARYAGMYPRANVNGAASTYFKGEAEAPRTELVRVELDSADSEVADSLEIVAEYAVDLKFGITRTDPGAAPNFLPVVTRYPIGDANVYNQTKSVQAGGLPNRVSAVQVRLATRSAAGDRRTDINAPGNHLNADGSIWRYDLGTTVDDRWRYARVRTLVSDVLLANQAGVTW
jgi:prepilin-type N-terminal cleavage/methylation domain-containing protein